MICAIDETTVVTIENINQITNKAESGDAIAQYLLGKYFFEEGEKEKAYKWALKSAKQNYRFGIELLGIICEYGECVTSDNHDAFYLFSEVAVQGLAEAQYNLGRCFELGIGTERNAEKAFNWYLRAAEQGIAAAQFNVGFFLMNGIEVQQDESKAFEWFLKAAEQGLAEAQFNVGIFFLNGRGVQHDDSKAFEWFSKAAEQGNAVAQFNVGCFFMNGIEVQQDDSKAFEWFLKAAEQGFEEAQFNVGISFVKGRGVQHDDSKAFEWFLKAAEQGNAAAQFNVGCFFMNGIEVQHDDSKAFEWFLKAAEQGYGEAQNNIGACYVRGIGTTKDKTKAFKWYLKAAKQGYSVAQLNAGICYYEGVGTTVNKKRAYSLLIESAKQGNHMAEFLIGGLYCGENYQELYKWIKRAADAGIAYAQVVMAYFYLNANAGIGVNKDIALEWIEKALKNEDPYVDYCIGYLYLVYLQDYKKAEYYLSKAAAEKELFAAKNWLSVICFSQKRDKEGFRIAQESAEANDPLGCFILASAYYHGKGVEKSESDGDRYYKKAIDNHLLIEHDDSIVLDAITEKKTIDFEKLYSEQTYLSSFLKTNPFPKTDFILAKYQQTGLFNGGGTTLGEVKGAITNALNNILGARPIIMEEKIKRKKHISSSEEIKVGDSDLFKHYSEKLDTLNVEKAIEPAKYLDYYAWSARASVDDYWKSDEYKEIKKVFDYFETNDINMDICNTDIEACLEILRLLFPEKGVRAIQKLYGKICEEHSRRNTYIISLSNNVAENNSDNSNIEDNYFYVKADKKNSRNDNTYEEKGLSENTEYGNQFTKLRHFILEFEKKLRRGTSVEVCSIFLAKLLFPFPSNNESNGEINKEPSVYRWLDKMTKRMTVSDIEEVMAGTQFFSANIHWFFEEQLKNARAMSDEEICKRLDMLPPQFNRTCNKSLEPKLLEFWEDNKEKFED